MNKILTITFKTRYGKVMDTYFHWTCHPEAEQFLEGLINDFVANNGFLATLASQLKTETSTRLFDWIDHLRIPKTESNRDHLFAIGFTEEGHFKEGVAYRHPGAQLPSVFLLTDPQAPCGLALKVDSIGDFLMVHGVRAAIQGSPLSSYRIACADPYGSSELYVVERRGSRSFDPKIASPDFAGSYIRAKEIWQTRERHSFHEDDEFRQAFAAAHEMVELVGQDMAAWIVLECERDYWQARNQAGKIQKGRQDRLGMGWANHDHHTFRSSRRFFKALVQLFELLGFHCRERFYAGKEAGWGAQVMENSNAGLVLFLDVDLGPDEVAIDFAHQDLPERDQLGTIGLWCGLHGDSILKAGMHHLEAQFLFEELTHDLSNQGVGMMEPFSNFSYLRQAFTKGEIWAVNPRRLQILLDKKYISPEQAQKFREKGALGSHLENLQRREGYKGFNQKNVSFIIHKTDPRGANLSGA